MLTCLIASLALTGPKGYTFVYRPPLNKTYRYRVTMSLAQSTAGLAKDGFEMQMDLEMRTKSRTGDLTTIESKVVSAKVEGSPGSPNSNSFKQMEAGMLGKTSTIVMDSHFKPASIKTPGAAAAVGQGMTQSMQSFTFPSKPIQIGESWSNPMDLAPMLGAMVKTVKFTGSIPVVCRLQSVQGTIATLALSMKGTVKGVLPEGTMVFAMNLKGTCTIDLNGGLTVSSTLAGESLITMGSTRSTQHLVNSMRKL